MSVRIPHEEKQKLVLNLQDYFKEQGWEEIGNLEAAALFDYIVQAVAPYIYNQALYDARLLVTERLQAVEEDLYTLEKSIRK
ncbi:MAG: DUF2164 domain-containing protein [Ectobacillus sp.]